MEFQDPSKHGSQDVGRYREWDRRMNGWKDRRMDYLKANFLSLF